MKIPESFHEAYDHNKATMEWSLQPQQSNYQFNSLTNPIQKELNILLNVKMKNGQIYMPKQYSDPEIVEKTIW